jgi:hypothetical protein
MWAQLNRRVVCRFAFLGLIAAFAGTSRAQEADFFGIYHYNDGIVNMYMEFREDGTGVSTWVKDDGRRTSHTFTYRLHRPGNYLLVYRLRYDGFGDQGLTVGTNRIGKEIFVNQIKDGREGPNWSRFVKVK